LFLIALLTSRYAPEKIGEAEWKAEVLVHGVGVMLTRHGRIDTDRVTSAGTPFAEEDAGIAGGLRGTLHAASQPFWTFQKE
jgi:hypothetical protein